MNIELSENERKHLKRLSNYNKKWKRMNVIGGIIAILFSFGFVFVGAIFFLRLYQRFSSLEAGGFDDLKIAYTLWCYTFILLGFSNFLTGYILIYYSKDVNFLFSLIEKHKIQVGTENPTECDKKTQSCCCEKESETKATETQNAENISETKDNNVS